MQLFHRSASAGARASSFAVSRALMSVNAFALAGACTFVFLGCAPEPPVLAPEPAGLPPSAARAEQTEPSYGQPAPATAADAAPLEPAAAPEPVSPVALDVPGFRPAVLLPPADAQAKRPILVAAHGAGDSPEWQCQIWGAIVKGRGFVLCPRGLPMSPDVPVQDPGYFYRDHWELAKELAAALEALVKSYGPRVDPGPIVYTGYSQGATMGALVTSKQPARFSKLVLIEGGHAEWDVPTARAFKTGGGERILFACGQGHCARSARQSVRWLERSGVDVRLEYVEGAGHTYGGPVAERLNQSFGWLVAGDSRWGENPR
jgi:predicted esterase